MKLYLAKPQGYCAGVERAIKLALDVRDRFPNETIYILGMLVHNEVVIKQLEKHQIYTEKGTKQKIIDFLKVVDKKAHLIITAHGAPTEYREIIEERGLIVHDATCPIVAMNMKKIGKALNNDRQIIYIGKENHPEVNAALSLGKNIFLYPVKGAFDFTKITDKTPFVINQTTLSILELSTYHQDIQEHIPGAIIVDELCNATRMRQLAVMKIPQDVDLIYIVGSTYSSNTNKLVEVAKETHPNTRVKLIGTVKDIDNNDLKSTAYIGISSGASTPKVVVDEVINYLNNY